MSVRWKDKPQLVDLAGTEILAATSIAGGAKVGGGSVAENGDVGIPVSQVLAAALAAARTPEVVSAIVSDTITPTGTTDVLRALGVDAALAIANPSSTPADGAGFIAYLEDDGTTRALTWGSMYANSEFATLPAATTAGKRHRLGFEYNATDDKLYCMYAEVEA